MIVKEGDVIYCLPLTNEEIDFLMRFLEANEDKTIAEDRSTFLSIQSKLSAADQS